MAVHGLLEPVRSSQGLGSGVGHRWGSDELEVPAQGLSWFVVLALGGGR